MPAPDPFTPGRVFCVGLAGSGVRAMAELLRGFGWEVSGTDRAKPDVLARLRAKGVAATHDPDGKCWDERPDLLLCSPAVPPTDSARVRAAAEGVPEATHIDLLAELTRRRETIAVAGTHGKSGTAALLVHLLRTSGRRVAGFVGAEPVDPGYSFAEADPELLVVEACEWNRHFLRLEPRHAVVTGVEFDHPDTYRNAGELEGAFAEFARGIHTAAIAASDEAASAVGFLLYATDSPGAKRALGNYGWEFCRGGHAADTLCGLAGGYLPNADGSAVAVSLHEQGCGEPIVVPVPPHALPANVAFAAAGLEWMRRRSDRLYQQAPGHLLEEVAPEVRFAPALRRRFEVLGDWRDRTVIDDYAHHPTALREVRPRAQRLGSSGRAAVVFQPHQFARTEALFNRFAGALSGYGAAAVLPVFPARETASGDECREMSRRLAAAAGATFLPDLDAVPGWADDSTAPGDAVVLAGAGDIDAARHLFFPDAPGA